MANQKAMEIMQQMLQWYQFGNSRGQPRVTLVEEQNDQPFCQNKGGDGIEAVSRPKFSVSSLVGTVFDSEDVAKITKIEGNSYTLLFEDGFEMLGITADQLVELSSWPGYLVRNHRLLSNNNVNCSPRTDLLRNRVCVFFLPVPKLFLNFSVEDILMMMA